MANKQQMVVRTSNSGGVNNILTSRQRQYLCLAAWSNKQIAVKLGVTAQRVKNVFGNIYRRLDVEDLVTHTRIAAVTKALELGEVTLEELSDGPRDRLPSGWHWRYRR